MSLNPLQFSEEVKKQYLRYQLTSSRIADPVLGDQFEDHLWRSTSASSLFKGPYVSLSRAYKEGASVEDLVTEAVLHPAMNGVVEHPNLYHHQEKALRAVKAGRDVLVTTGTGSGKTEAFLYPIIDRCLELQSEPEASEGVRAVVVYPMNALASDQLERLRELLVGTGVTFGLFVGPTPEDESELPYQGEELPEGTTRDEYQELREEVAEDENLVHLPPEERYTRGQIREDPPDILLVNKAILEFQLTRGSDLDLFLDAPIEYLVVDEAHTNTGAQGAEVAMLLRRLEAIADPPKGRITHLATSATIVDQDHEDEAERFMARLFGVDAGDVAVVQESYEGIDWPDDRYAVSRPPNPEQVFRRALDAASLGPGTTQDREVAAVYEELTGQRLPQGNSLSSRLYEGLIHNELAYHLDRSAITVRNLDDLVDQLWEATGRVERRGAREEVLTYLILGALAERDDTPLFRPKLHYFVKGLEGAVAVLDKGGDGERPTVPTLFLSPEQAEERYEGRRDETAFFPVKVCPQCGQHHYEQYLQDVTSGAGDELRGGQQVDGGTVFWADPGRSHGRVLFTDSVIDADEDESPGDKYLTAQACYACGSLHTGEIDTCGRCDRTGTLVDVYVLDSVDKVSSCPVCAYRSRYYDDPFRALKEVTVENVHVLAQDMLNQADEQGRRLIVFTDNRQEAAFQAGWMQDRARRYRFRRLLYKHLPDALDQRPEGPGHHLNISIETVVDEIVEALVEDKSLAKTIAPEAFEEEMGSSFDAKLREALERFVRVHILREITSGYRARASLEGWGRLQVHYDGLHPQNPRVQEFAARWNRSPEEMTLWLENILDVFRRKRYLHHPKDPIFSRTWDNRNDLVRNRYLPKEGHYPKGLRKESPDDEDAKNYVKGWQSQYLTTAGDWARRIGIGSDDRVPFLEDAWNLLLDDLELFTRLDALRWGGGGSIKGTHNVAQVDATKVGITQHQGRYQCDRCGTYHARSTPRDACTRWHCQDGTIEPVDDKEEPRDYDLVALDDATTYVMPAEHTAQVPNKQRAHIEAEFKEGRGVNCLVATPTLELGVDIGALDMVLLRNVPPRPANYWQRAGRAGRRNRMAVIFTYVRSNPHDLHFYKQPEALLGGAVRPPNFNLQNPVMVRKHVHAAVLTQLHAELLHEDEKWIEHVIPIWIGNALFDGAPPRQDLDAVIEPLRKQLKDQERRDHLMDVLQDTFQVSWPDDPSYVSDETLATYLDEMPDELEAAYQRVLDRLLWAWNQRRRLYAKGSQGQELDEEEKRFLSRCESTVTSLRPGSNGGDKGYRNYTLSVLSREGFLPGYADARDHVVAMADKAYSRGWDSFKFELARPKSIAIHEHVPGNRIYANGGKYQLRRYVLPASDEVRDPERWTVNPETWKVQNKLETEAGYHDPLAQEIPSLPLVDSDLSFVNHVEDMETTRFRMPSIVKGTLRKRHDGGSRYEFQDHTVDHRKSQRIVLLNFGPRTQEDEGDAQEMGFPICRVCGGLRSPYDNEDRIRDFIDHHKEICGESPGRFALHVATTVDGLLFDDLDEEAEAVSLGEALTLLGTHLFEMERDDLRWFTICHSEDDYSLFLYDPMPGGSGLLDQMMTEWPSVVDAGEKLLARCPGGCAESCYDCLRTYYNQFFHDMLSRQEAMDLIHTMGKTPSVTNPIEPLNEVEPVDEEAAEENRWEKMLKEIIQDEWGFTGFQPQVKVEIPTISAWTKPDLVHKDAKIAIYLDGPIHSEEEVANRDRFLRTGLESEGWKVLTIHIEDFENTQMMQLYRQQVAQKLSS